MGFSAGKDAAEQVVSGGAERVEQGQGDAEGIKAGTGADDQKNACKAKQRGKPAQRGDGFAHEPASNQHDEEGGEVDDGDSFTHGHDAQGEHHGKRACDKRQAAQQHKAGAIGAPEGGTMAGAEDGGKQADVDEKTQGKDKGHGVKHGQMLAHGIRGGEQQDGEGDECHALEGVLAVGGGEIGGGHGKVSYWQKGQA